MNVTMQKLKELLSQQPPSASGEHVPFTIGKAYLFRLVTHYWLGRVVSVGTQEIVIECASWIPDTGRFHACLRDGIMTQASSEIEPVPGRVTLGRGALVDASLWVHELPVSAK